MHRLRALRDSAAVNFDFPITKVDVALHCHLSDTDSLSALSLLKFLAVPYIQFQDGLFSASFVQQS